MPLGIRIRSRRPIVAVLAAYASAPLVGSGCEKRYAACRPPAECHDVNGSGGSGSSSASGGAMLGGNGGFSGEDGWGGEAGFGGSTGPIGHLGQPCPTPGVAACADTASRFVLFCDDGTWTAAGQCSSTERCATEGNDVGTCQAIVPQCIDHAPGDWVCRGAVRFRCGTDLVDEVGAETCPEACVDGVCSQCRPDTEALPTCSNNHLLSCSATGKWVATACPADTPYCSDGACGTPPSCLGLAQTCGPAPVDATGSETCCASSLVEGGAFDWDNNSTYQASVSTFRLDRFEVTVGRFRRFKLAWDAGWRPNLGAGKHSHLRDGLGLADASPSGGFESGWEGISNGLVVLTDDALLGGGGTDFPGSWTSTPQGKESRPINYVNAYEATAFCIWDGAFLPSGAEWSYAASGGADQRTYPWGEEIPQGNADLAIYGCWYGGQNGSCAAMGGGAFPLRVSPVGFATGIGKYGQADLAGNLGERTQGGPATVSFCEDCFEGSGTPGTVIERVRGGAFDSPLEGIGSAYSEEIDPLERRAQVGFRCARPP